MPGFPSTPFPPISTNDPYRKIPGFPRQVKSRACWRAKRRCSCHRKIPAALGNRLFSKPAGRAQAAEQLHLLAGHTHELHSAIAVARDTEIMFSDVVVAGMTMRRLDESGIEAYLDQAGQAVTTSVGAYQLEGLGVHLFERIEGDHFTILGLPLLPLLKFLRGEGLLGV
jgi:septum formation protein